MCATRLSPESWIKSGFSSLQEQGPMSLKAEPLARQLKTTKGSFYWHFADVPAFHCAMLEHWETAAMRDIDAVLEGDASPVQRLRHLGQITIANHDTQKTPDTIEPAIRAWARSSPQAAETVARVDAKRMSDLKHALQDAGLSNPELSRIIYAANIGMAELSVQDGQDNKNALGTLVDLILALYE